MQQHSSASDARPDLPGLRRLVWFNIVIQTAFPLAVAFTPVIAGAGEQHFLPQRAPLTMQRTQVYTLGNGESINSVAKKYHLTLNQLRELNQFRTFAHGFDHLKAGDELDVPLAPLPEVRWNGAPRVSASDTHDEDAQAQKVAGYASQAGGFLTNNPNGDAAASMARGMATGAAGGEIQQWLSRFGTARVQLGADKNFSLKNSQFDLLMPLYDQGDNLIFTQGSLHRTDDRTQTNLGAGLRHFTPSYMVGGNLFGDYDLSRDHARMGVGVEYWRDFLKLGANGYLRLTGWKDSPDLADYQERPANGWDIRAQAWVPALPQLGGKLTYEQYYGKEVALFGVDNRQKNPHAITAGVNYTPVPLITLGAEQRQGQSGKNDSRFTVDMNYQLGIPWRSQLEPAAVAAMRSLAGSRYDLVERNNNIVLEYRKKDVIHLKMADLVTGYAGEQKSLGVSVNSKYGLARIDWSASPLIAAGGKIVQNGADYTVVLPAYQTMAQAVNTYTVSGVAIDTRGNRSDRSDTQVTVQAPEVNRQYSTFTPASSMLPADGRSSQALTLTLRDGNNQPVDMDVKDISLKSSALKSATVSALTRKSAGVYTVMVTAGTDVENVTLTPTVTGITLSSAAVTVNSAEPDAGRSVFTATPDTIVANNTATSTLTLIAKNAQGNVLTGLKDSLAFVLKDSSGKAPARGIITEGAIAESATKGTYTATLKGTAADKYTVVPQFNGSALGSLSATVTLTATTPDQAKSAIKTDNTTYASGADMLITVTLKDANGNAVTGAAASLTTEAVTVVNATLKTGSSWKDNGDGTYTGTYTATTAGTGLKATVKLGGWDKPAESGAYAITATTPDQAKSAIKTDNTTYASGADMLITVTLKDANGNAVTGAAASLTTEAVTVVNATLKTGSSWKDNGDGTYTGTYTATTAGTGLKATVKLGGWDKPAESGAYAITATTPDQAKSAIKTDNTTYASGADMLITVTLKDANGNAVTGAAASLTTEAVTVVNATLKTGSSWKDNGDGTYTGTYTATTAGTGLKATVKLGGWDKPAESGAYAITATTPDQAKSAIKTDNTTYASGADMLITVTLKDANGNAVTGAAASLTTEAVTVVNATLKTGSSWKDNGDGTYTGTYTATTAGTGLKATVKLGGWDKPAESGAYAITATTPDQAKSAIKTDNTTYASGADMLITVTLKDANGNAVTGAAASLTTEAVTVVNATLKTGSSWKDNGDGTYTGTYTATTAGTGLKATVKLGGWDKPAESGAYAITATTPDQAKSAIKTDNTTYASGADMLITVTLKDANGNAVTGAAASLTTEAVTVVNATLKTGSSWKDNGDGTYTGTYTATTAGTGLKATVKLGGWDKPAESGAYAITATTPDPGEVGD
ncbi:Invasin [Cedecea neteri]|uniref:Invasin n=1 Tax=Cedecea neteri TaxID=158822 RepID=A0A2X2V7G4_9ENTR|nr:Invasin [Cedecea neteri]